MQKDTRKTELLIAFRSAVISYVPWHNKNAWNTLEGDKLTQLINDANKYDVVTSQDIATGLSVPLTEVDKWKDGLEIPKPKMRKEVKALLLEKINLQLKT